MTNKAQALGSTNSYAKRYCLCNALNIVVTDEDLDGQIPGHDIVSEEEADRLRELADQVSKEDRERLLAWAGVETWDEFPSRIYKQALRAYGRKIAK